jgi:hypothetical protein
MQMTIELPLKLNLKLGFMLVQEEKYLHASLTIKVIPDANVKADYIITSVSPKVV